MKYEVLVKITRCGNDGGKANGKPCVVFTPIEKGKDIKIFMPEQDVVNFANHFFKQAKITIEV